MPSEANSSSGTGPTLLTNKPSATVTSTGTAEPTSPPMNGSGGIKRSCLHKKLGIQRGSMAFKKLARTGHRSRAVPFLWNVKINIKMSSAAALTAGPFTCASSTLDVPAVEVDDNGALTILPRVLPVQNRTSNS